MTPVVSLVILSACSPPPPPKVEIAAPKPSLSDKVHRLSATEARAWMQQHPDGMIVDAREETEFQNHGRIAGATLLSQLAGETTLTTLEEQPRDRPILLYCALGSRSAWLAADLEARGFQDIAILEGGLHAWKDAGLPVEP